jgi:phosphate uptake regulator
MLDQDAVAIVDESAGALERSHLAHYDEVGTDERRRRLQSLFDVVVLTLRSRDLVPMHDHAERIAQERFAAGVDIAEVQTAFNVLEEVLWRRTVAAAPARRSLWPGGRYATGGFNRSVQHRVD